MKPHLETELGYVFKDKQLLKLALTHSSFVYENNLGHTYCNQRLEFLGDAVLELLTSDMLYLLYPKLSEGELSKIRANMVCEPSLAARAREISLGKYLRLGRGESVSGGAKKDSILSDALEAVIGAIYLDGGLEFARTFVQKLFKDSAEDGENATSYKVISDHKSHLQEELQKISRIPLEYTIIQEVGPAHQKEFTAQVSHDNRILGTGIGKSKKEAEQNAAASALLTIV